MDEVVAVANASADSVVLQDSNVGTNGTIRRAFDEGFAGGADFVLHLEEDIAVAVDAFRFIDWAVRFVDDNSIGVASLWRNRRGWSPGGPCERKANEMTCAAVCDQLPLWGWGTWRDRWEEIGPIWSTGPARGMTSWDCWMRDHWPRSRACLAPLCSRAQNIGSESGQNRGCAVLPWWSESGPYQGDFHLVTVKDRPVHIPENAWRYGDASGLSSAPAPDQPSHSSGFS